jgi:hypothetical protein
VCFGALRNRPAIAKQELAAFLTKYPQDEIAGAARIPAPSVFLGARMIAA